MPPLGSQRAAGLPAGPPQLLVSVRHAGEVSAALAGGACLIDVKDPSRGSLGRADSSVWRDIARRLQAQATIPPTQTDPGGQPPNPDARPNRIGPNPELSRAGRVGSSIDKTPSAACETAPHEFRADRPLVPPPLPVSLSLALGELLDWVATTDVEPPAFPPGTRYVKLGVAGLSLSAVADHWRSTLDRRARQPLPPRIDTASGDPAWVSPDGTSPIEWVLACYADHVRAQAPAPEQLFELAAELGCQTVLVDTHDKQGPGLLECCPLTRLEQWLTQTRELGLQLALAGRVRLEEAPLLGELGPAIVGIRSAGCVAGERAGELDASRVRSFAEGLARGATLAPRGPKRSLAQPIARWAIDLRG